MALTVRWAVVLSSATKMLRATGPIVGMADGRHWRNPWHTSASGRRPRSAAESWPRSCPAWRWAAATTPLEKGADYGDDDRRMRALEGNGTMPDPSRHHRAPGADRPSIRPLGRRAAGGGAQMSRTMLMASTNRALRSASRLPKSSPRRARNPPGPMPNRNRRRSMWSITSPPAPDGGGAAVGHVDRTGAELHGLGAVDQAGEEHQARCHRFGDVRAGFADEPFAARPNSSARMKASAVFLENLRIAPARRMQRHEKKDSFINRTSPGC